jgi:hypothetical protein
MSKYDHDDDMRPAQAVFLVILCTLPWLVLGIYLWMR